MGAALFFPTNSYAEKADHSPKHPIQEEKVIVQKQKQAIKDQVKEVPEKPKNQEKSVKIAKPKKSEMKTDKVLGKQKALPEQASPKAKEAKLSAGKKQKSKRMIPAKKAVNKGNKKSKRSSLNRDSSKQDKVKKPSQAKEKTTSIVSNENKFVHEIKIVRPITIEKNIVSQNSLSLNSKSPEKQKTPDPVKSFPDQILMIFSPGSHYSGGSVKDRKNTGLNTNSLNDKWFLRWETYWIRGPNESFVFQSHKVSNQWMNAPPCKPPKSFLFS